MSTSKQQYRVLARKYRPKDFSDLIGQEVLVKVLSNAISQNRLAHAFIFTGVRGVGKTTTARILARILQCKGKDGSKDVDIYPCGECENCLAIDQDHHVDVLEMDAASRTGVDDIREIIEGVRYRPVMGRYKIYIIDEVHMLSKQAFNALLKTLEEPPEHAKFIFATTEIRRVPVTILSRCQRFDLKRVDQNMLNAHFQKIIKNEGYEIEENALNFITKAADGSVRDGLSILDQAISQSQASSEGEQKVTANDVQNMLGIIDRTETFSLIESLLKGDIASCLATFEILYQQSADPLIILQDLSEYTHMVLRQKVQNDHDLSNKAVLVDMALSDVIKEKMQELSKTVSVPVLTRFWQMLLKGINETKMAQDPFRSIEMLFIRMAYLADKPTLWEAATTSIQQKQAMDTGAQPSSPAAQAQASVQAPVNTQTSAPQSNLAVKPTSAIENQPKLMLNSLEDLMQACEQESEALLLNQIKCYVQLVKFEFGKIDLKLAEGASESFIPKLNQFLYAYTGKRWLISLSSGEADLTLKERETQELQAEEAKVQDHPMTKKILLDFPGAKIISFQRDKKDN